MSQVIGLGRGECLKNSCFGALQVNGGDHALHEFVASLGVEKLPYFQFYRCGEVLSQFAANLSKIRQLRSEIERLKKKTLDACILDSQRQIVQKLARE